MIPVTSQHTTATAPEETIDLSVTQQGNTTPPVRLHDSESLVTEPSTTMELQAPSPVNPPITEVSSPQQLQTAYNQRSPLNLKRAEVNNPCVGLLDRLSDLKDL